MADEDLKAELERLKAENETLKKRRSSAVSMKVSEKGAVSVYGLGRFPVTLYQEQWNKLLSMADEIKQFIVGRANGTAPRGSWSHHRGRLACRRMAGNRTSRSGLM